MKIKHVLTKILTSLLVITMSFSLCINVYAEDGSHLKNSNSINTISGNDDEKVVDFPNENYSSLKEFVTTLSGGEVIKLNNDIILDETIAFNKSDIVLDLNGYTISESDGFKGNFLIRSSKQLTIRDSSQNNTGKIISYKKIAIHIAGSLVLESGTIEGNGAQTITISSNASLNILGGKIESKNIGIRTISATNCNINVKGGEIIGTTAISADEGIITITDGLVKGSNYGLLIQNAKLNVKGGETVGATAVLIKGNAEIIVDDGTVTGESTGINAASGSITVNGGLIKGNSYGLNVQNVKLNVKGGNIEAGNDGIRVKGDMETIITNGTVSGTNAGINAESGNITIINGKVHGNIFGIKTQNTFIGNIKIEGGEIISEDTAVSTGAGNVTITNGTIKGVNFGLNVQNVKLNIEGGIIEADIDGIRIKSTEMIVTGGKIIGNNSSIYAVDVNEENKSYVTIKGGEYFIPAISETSIIRGGNNNVVISDGTFYNKKPSVTYIAPGYRILSDDESETGLYRVANHDIEVVDAKEGAQRYYSSLRTAMSNGKNIKLLGNVTESVTIVKGEEITLDLNGYTLTGIKDIDGSMKNILTNNGTLTIIDSSESKTGTIMGGSDNGDGITGQGGIPLVNNGTCVIEAGNIKRGDDNTFGNYTIRNNGNLTINGGNVTNNSNENPLLINSDSVGFSSTLIINGGNISQPNGIAVKNEFGFAKINGGTISSDTSYALQCWADTEISAGNIIGSVVVFTRNNTKAELNITGGTIGRGDQDYIRAWNYFDKGSAKNAPVINISKDAVVNGVLEAVETRANGENYICRDSNIASIKTTGGSFDRKVPDYACSNGYASQLDESGRYIVKPAVSTKYVGGSLLIKDIVEKVNMRFAYTFALPENCSIEDVELVWNWGTADNNLNKEVKCVSYVLNGDGTYTANLVINNIPVDTIERYSKNIYVRLIARYNGVDDNILDENIGDIIYQSAKDVAHNMLLSANLDEDHKAYIEKLISLYESQDSNETK